MDIQDRKLLIIERIIRIDSESLLEQIDELLNQEGFKINEERKIKDDPTWRGILNLAGFALIVTFWQGFFSRICELPIVPPGWTQSIKDYSEIFLIGVVLCAAWVGSHAQHDRTKNHVTWIKKRSWSFQAGCIFLCLYVEMIIFSFYMYQR